MLSAAAKPIPRNTTKWDGLINTVNRSEQAGRTNVSWMLRMLTSTPSLWKLPPLWENAMAARKGCASEVAEEHSHVGLRRRRKCVIVIVPKEKWWELEGAAVKIRFGASSTDWQRDPRSGIYQKNKKQNKQTNNIEQLNQEPARSRRGQQYIAFCCRETHSSQHDEVKRPDQYSIVNRSEQAGRTIFEEMRTAITLITCYGCRERLHIWGCWRGLKCWSVENTRTCHGPSSKVARTERGPSKHTLRSILHMQSTERSSHSNH